MRTAHVGGTRTRLIESAWAREGAAARLQAEKNSIRQFLKYLQGETPKRCILIMGKRQIGVIGVVSTSVPCNSFSDLGRAVGIQGHSRVFRREGHRPEPREVQERTQELNERLQRRHGTVGYLDDNRAAPDRGADEEGRESQEHRLQSELSKVEASMEEQLAVLGRAVLEDASLAPLIKKGFPDEYARVTGLMQKTSLLKDRIEELRRPPAKVQASVTGSILRASCPTCGGPITLDMSFCPTCGHSLDELRHAYRMCPACGVYYKADYRFCMECGSQTVEIPPSRQAASQVTEHDSRGRGSIQADWEMLETQATQVTEPQASPEHQVRESQALQEHLVQVESRPGNQDQGDDGLKTLVTDGEPLTDCIELEHAEDAAAEQETNKLPCPSCGALNDCDARFCGECGASLR